MFFASHFEHFSALYNYSSVHGDLEASKYKFLKISLEMARYVFCFFFSNGTSSLGYWNMFSVIFPE